MLGLVTMLVSSNVKAQDYIYLENKDGRIAATSIEVLSNETRYFKYGDESGQVYSINNNQISMIAYENGQLKFFEKPSKIASSYNYKKNIIHYHLFDLVVNNFKLSYERIISQGKIGIQIPVAFGYGDEFSGFDNLVNNFYSGLSLNFYPTGQGKIRYFMGPGIQVGSGSYDYEYYPLGYGYPPVHQKQNTFLFRFLVNNGVIFSPIKELSLSAVGSLGIRYVEDTNYYDEDHVKTVGAFSFNLSYRF